MAKKKHSLTEQQVLTRKLIKLWNRGQSDYCEVRGSEIHGRGVYATCDIAKGMKIIEYVGEIIDKDESGKRGISQHDKSLRTGDAAVYIFTLSKKYDIDGNVPWNIARLINHSCNPNCEAWIEGRKIFIHSLSDIQAGEEHPCLCGKDQCIGYIVSRSQWDELGARLKLKK